MVSIRQIEIWIEICLRKGKCWISFDTNRVNRFDLDYAYAIHILHTLSLRRYCLMVFFSLVEILELPFDHKLI